MWNKLSMQSMLALLLEDLGAFPSKKFYSWDWIWKRLWLKAIKLWLNDMAVLATCSEYRTNTGKWHAIYIVVSLAKFVAKPTCSKLANCWQLHYDVPLTNSAAQNTTTCTPESFSSTEAEFERPSLVSGKFMHGWMTDWVTLES